MSGLLPPETSRSGGHVTSDTFVRGVSPAARERPGVLHYRKNQRRPLSGELEGPEQN